MNEPPVRVAVQMGTATVRVAGAPADGAARLIAELPAPGPGVAELLADLVGSPLEELLLVHPGSWPEDRAAGWAAECAALALRVRTVPAPLAAAGRGGCAVLDVGASGAEAVLLGELGEVGAWHRTSAGGLLLDQRVATRFGLDPGTTMAAREALSLLPDAAGLRADQVRPVLAAALAEAVAALRAVVADGATPVRLVGGVARCPVLAELVDAAGFTDVTVVPRPDAAAVLGALALPAAAVRERAPEPSRPDGDPPRRLPPLRPRRRGRAALVAAATAASAVLLVAAGHTPGPGTAAARAQQVVAQYGYRMDVPSGWEHTGGLPERRRVLLTPVSAPEGSDRIVVELSRLGYDATAEPERARAELLAVYDGGVAGGAALSGYDADARFAGRAVTTFREQQPYAVVDWFVILDGAAQLSVGCAHAPAAGPGVLAACATVVGSVRSG